MYIIYIYVIHLQDVNVCVSTFESTSAFFERLTAAVIYYAHTHTHVYEFYTARARVCVSGRRQSTRLLPSSLLLYYTQTVHGAN